eukprot:1194408-Prorocentrum_minimum.AAC.6
MVAALMIRRCRRAGRWCTCRRGASLTSPAGCTTSPTGWADATAGGAQGESSGRKWGTGHREDPYNEVLLRGGVPLSSAPPPPGHSPESGGRLVWLDRQGRDVDVKGHVDVKGCGVDVKGRVVDVKGRGGDVIRRRRASGLVGSTRKGCTTGGTHSANQSSLTFCTPPSSGNDTGIHEPFLKY